MEAVSLKLPDTLKEDELLYHDYRTLDSVVRLGDVELPMEAIYRKTVFDS